MRSASNVVLLLLAASTQAVAQPVRRVILPPANAKLSAEFVGITSLREIADGRVIVTDGRDQVLYLADFRGNTVVILGGKGKGPGEYSQVGFIRETTGDSSILGDMLNRRWLLFDGARIVATIPPDHPAIKATQSLIAGTDRFGHVLINKHAPERNGSTVVTRKDSFSLVLVDRATGRSDTVARLRELPREKHIEMDSDGRIHRSYSTSTEPNPRAEEALLASDGWIAVLRLEPLRIDWRTPTGEWVKGAPLPLKPDVVTARERKAIEQRHAANNAELKRNGMPPLPPPEIPQSLTVFATFRHMNITSDGRLAVKRTSTVAAPENRWVIINRKGTIDGEFVIGAKEDIAGFGPKTIYISSKDDDDIQTLRRHPWPP